MDNNAQNQPVQEPAVQITPIQPVVEQPTVASPIALPPDEQQAAAPAQSSPPTAPAMPQGVSPRPEMGPVAVANPVAVDAENDEQPVVRQEAPIIQQSHPEVVMPKEVASAGVTPGPDADSKQLPEEKQQLETVSGEEPPAENNAAGDEGSLPMSYQQALEEQKKIKSPKSGMSWIIREILRQWRKRFQPE